MEHRVVRLAAVFSAATVVAFGTPGCHGVQVVGAFGGPAVQGSGKKASENRTVPAFKGIVFPGSGKVDYRIGSPQGVRIETDDNLLSHVETKVVDGKLLVGFKGSISTRIGLNVTIVAAACESAELSGSGSIRVAVMKSDRLDAVVTGSGNITAVGEAKSVKVVVSGSGNVDLSKVQTGNAEVQVTGSGDILVAPKGSLEAQITGSGQIRYRGEPKQITKSITGSGSVTKG